jgi:hypothetical protein
MRLVYPILKKARGLVIASPVYWFSVSAQTKIFMDRLYAFIGPKGHGLKGKNISILLIYGDIDPFSSGAVNALRMFQDAFNYVGAPIAGCGRAGPAGGRRRAEETCSRRGALSAGRAFPRAPLAGLEQKLQIIEVLVPPRASLVPDQLLQPDEVNRQRFVVIHEAFRRSASPGCRKTDAVDAVEEIQSVRRIAELKHHTLSEQVAGTLDARHGASPELTKGCKEAGRIAGLGIEKYIGVGGEAGIAVLDDCLASHDEVAHTALSQDREELEDIPVERDCFHFRRCLRGRRGAGLGP